MRSLNGFSLPPALSHVGTILRGLKGPRGDFGSIRVTNAGNGNSMSDVATGVFRGTKCGATLFVSPFMVSFHREVRVGNRFVDRTSLIQCTRGIVGANRGLARFRLVATATFLCFTRGRYRITMVRAKLNNELSTAGSVSGIVMDIVAGVKLSRATILNSAVRRVAHRGYKVVGTTPLIADFGRPRGTVGILGRCGPVVPSGSTLRILGDSVANGACVCGNIRCDASLVKCRRVRGSLVMVRTIGGYNLEVDSKVVGGSLSRACFPTELRIMSGGPLVILSKTRGPSKTRTLTRFLGDCGKGTDTVVNVVQSGSISAILGAALPCVCGTITIGVNGLPHDVGTSRLYRGTGTCADYIATRDCSSTVGVLRDRSTIFIFNSLCLTSRVHRGLGGLGGWPGGSGFFASESLC